jgi:hypothetical protein
MPPRLSTKFLGVLAVRAEAPAAQVWGSLPLVAHVGQLCAGFLPHRFEIWGILQIRYEHSEGFANGP